MYYIPVCLTIWDILRVIKLFVVYLKFKFNWVSWILSGGPNTPPLTPGDTLWSSVLVSLGLSQMRRDVACSWLAGGTCFFSRVVPFVFGRFFVPALGWSLSPAGVKLAVRWSWIVLCPFYGWRACLRARVAHKLQSPPTLSLEAQRLEGTGETERHLPWRTEVLFRGSRPGKQGHHKLTCTALPGSAVP